MLDLGSTVGRESITEFKSDINDKIEMSKEEISILEVQIEDIFEDSRRTAVSCLSLLNLFRCALVVKISSRSPCESIRADAMRKWVELVKMIEEGKRNYESAKELEKKLNRMKKRQEVMMKALCILSRLEKTLERIEDVERKLERDEEFFVGVNDLENELHELEELENVFQTLVKLEQKMLRDEFPLNSELDFYLVFCMHYETESEETD